MEVVNKKVSMSVFLSMLIIISVASTLPVYAASPTFAAKATPTKAAYYLSEDVGINFELDWQYLTQNYTTNMELWNSTDKVADLETTYVVDGEDVANGSYTAVYTVSDLTEEVGSQSFVARVVESDTGLTIASAPLNFIVQSKSIAMSVAWNDANQDRTIDPAETVTFDVYLTWAFMNETTAATLKVNDANFEKIIDTVSVTAGSSSSQKTYITSFDSAGYKTLKFTLEDTMGEALATKTVSVSVGTSTSTTTPSSTDTASTVDGVFGIIYDARYLIIIFAGVCVIAYLLTKRK
ncbi:MAG: hypothetical protein ACOWW1_05620 [archaeon]